MYNRFIKSDTYSIELAFATYFLNRTNISGIITGGPIGGQKQQSLYKIDSRFNKENLIKKIYSINDKKNNISLYNLEGNDLINQVILEHDDHQLLRDNINKLSDYYWILTYDNQKEISKLYSDYNQYLYTLNYSANRVRKEKEFLIHSKNTVVETYDKVRLEMVSQ